MGVKFRSNAQGATNLPSVQTGQHEIQNHRIPLLRPGQIQACLAVVRNGDAMPFGAQASGQELDDADIVFDDQELHALAAFGDGFCSEACSPDGWS